MRGQFASWQVFLPALAWSVVAGAQATTWSGHWRSDALTPQQPAARFDLNIDQVDGSYRASLTTTLSWAVKDEPLDVRIEDRHIFLLAPGLSGASPVIEGALSASGDRIEGSWRYRYGTQSSRPVTLVRTGESSAPDYLQAPLQPIAKLIEVGGGRLNFTMIDGSGVTVVMFAGAGRNSTSWLPVQSTLARASGARVIAYDPAGSGRSDFDDRPYDAEHEVSQVHDALGQLGPRTPVIVVGHSYGGLLAQLYAARYPGEVKAAVLVDPVVPEYMTEARMPHIGRVDLSLASSEGPYHAAKTRSYRETVAKARHQPIPAHIPVTLLTCDDLQWWEQDEHRRAWRLSHENFVAGSPNRRLVLAKGAGHFINQDRPDLIVREVANHVTNIASAVTAKQAFEPAQPALLSTAGALANAWADYDDDADLDLAVSFENGEIRLYRNDAGVLTSVGAAVGLPVRGDVVRGLSWGDFDADGYPDLYAGTAVEPMATRNYLYRNERGVRFVESAAQRGVELAGADSRQANWIDFDNDGDLDLFVAHRSRSNRLFRNDGERFADVTTATGLGDPRRAVGSCWFDMDRDGDLDVFLANQQGDRDALYRNDAGRFTDVAAELGMDQPQRQLSDGGVGCTVGDYDNDGDFDLFVATYGRSLLYRNDGAGRFTEVAKSLGVDASGHNVGASWGDFDNDGRLDLYVAGYERAGAGIAPSDRLYRNEGNRFADVLPQMPTLNNADHGVQWADFDGDGDLDLSLTNSGARAAGHPLLRNELSAARRSSSLQVAVVDRNGRWTRAGAEVRLYDRNDKLLGTRLVATGDGYNSQGALPVHFGLAKLERVTVEVTFLTDRGRQTQRLTSIDPRKWHSKPLYVKQNP